MLESNIFAEERNVFIKTKLIGFKINKNCNSVSFLCLVSFKLPFKMQILRSLMLSSSALKCNGRGKNFYCLIECVRLLNQYLIFPPVSHIYCASGHFWQ